MPISVALDRSPDDPRPFIERAKPTHPSLIDTDITGDAMSAERRAEIVASVPMGRLGEAREVAGCCLFLASDLSSYCTGTEVDVNGGSHIH